MSVSRETCKACWRPSPVGFHVPDAVWRAAVPHAFVFRVLCIMCFDGFATERGIVWCDDVQFFPVSGARHLQDQLYCTTCPRPVRDEAEQALAEREGIRRFFAGEPLQASSAIDNSTTYGYGRLDKLGYWQFPVPPALVELRAAYRKLEERHRSIDPVTPESGAGKAGL